MDHRIIVPIAIIVIAILFYYFMKNKEFDFSEYENYKDAQAKYLSLVGDYTQKLTSDVTEAVANELSDDELFKIYNTTTDKIHKLSKALVWWKIKNKV